MRPRLVAVAHGTRDSAGPQVVERLMRRVRRRLPAVDVVTCYVELVEPSLGSVMSAAASPSVVVPLLLSTGHHVTHDLPAAARESRLPVEVARPLGPHRLLAAATTTRLREAGAAPGDAVVLVAAGSSDPGALVDTDAAGRLLASRWGSPVEVAHLSGVGRPVADVVDELRQRGHARIAVAPYLLAPGYFARKAQALAQVHRATATADVLGAHHLVADVVVRRYVDALRTWPTRHLRRDTPRRPVRS